MSGGQIETRIKSAHIASAHRKAALRTMDRLIAVMYGTDIEQLRRIVREYDRIAGRETSPDNKGDSHG